MMMMLVDRFTVLHAFTVFIIMCSEIKSTTALCTLAFGALEILLLTYLRYCGMWTTHA